MFTIPLLMQVLLLAVCATSPSRDDPSKVNVLRRVSLQGDREVVVQKGPVAGASALQDLLPKRLLSPAVQGFFELSVVVRSKSSPSLTLWSHCYPVYLDTDYDEFAVLDLLLLPNRVVIVFSTSLSSISVCDVGVCGLTRYAGLSGIDWSLLGAAIPAPPGRLAAKLDYDEATAKISVVVTDRVGDHEKITRFVQKDERWEFESTDPRRFVPD